MRKVGKPMTIQNFIDECVQVVKDMNIEPSIDENEIRYEMIDGITNHFAGKGLDIVEYTCNGTKFSFDIKEKITLKTGQEVELNMEFIFSIVLKKTGNIVTISKTKNKYEKTVSDKPIKFIEVNIDYNIPVYKIEDEKVVIDEGCYTSEKVQFLEKLTNTDDIKTIVRKVDIEDIENEFDSSLCSPVIKRVMFFKTAPQGVDKFIDIESGNVDKKGLVDFIRKNMM